MATKRANGEGSIRKKIVKGKTYWEGRYIDTQGKQRSIGGKNQYEVREKLKKAQAKTEKERKADEVRKNGEIYYDKDMTLNAWYNIYMDNFTSHLKPQTKYSHSLKYKSAFLNTIGYKKVKCITEEELLTLITELKNRGLSVNTINSYYQFLTTLLNKAIQKDIIQTNPAKMVHIKPGSSKNPKRELTSEELKLLFETVSLKKEHLTPLLLFLQHTGCRLGEAISLEWKDITSDMQFCSINKTRTVYKNEQNMRIETDSSPKNLSSERIVPLDSDTKNMLKSLMKLRQEQGMFAPNKKIFLAQRLGTMHEGIVCRELNSISSFIQENYDEKFPNITSHWLRHTFASHAIEKNMPLLYLQKIGGWSNMNMISKVYGHMSGAQALNAVSGLWD